MANEIVLIFFYVGIFLYSVIIHEVAHGFVALKLGDPTAKYAGRLNLNPFRHLDLYGSVIVPLLMYLVFRFPFGWAKPVPYNPYNLKNQKWGPMLVALGGPGSNILLAVVAAVLGKLMTIPASVKIAIISSIQVADWSQLSTAISGSFYAIFFALFMIIIFWNVLLAFFNLIPFPPLDGSKLLFGLFPLKTETMIFFEQFGFVFLLVFILLFSGVLGAFLSLMLNIFYSFAI